jgi:hypothetical protein
MNIVSDPAIPAGVTVGLDDTNPDAVKFLDTIRFLSHLTPEERAVLEQAGDDLSRFLEAIDLGNRLMTDASETKWRVIKSTMRQIMTAIVPTADRGTCYFASTDLQIEVVAGDRVKRTMWIIKVRSNGTIDVQGRMCDELKTLIDAACALVSRRVE